MAILLVEWMSIPRWSRNCCWTGSAGALARDALVAVIPPRGRVRPCATLGTRRLLRSQQHGAIAACAAKAVPKYSVHRARGGETMAKHARCCEADRVHGDLTHVALCAASACVWRACLHHRAVVPPVAVGLKPRDADLRALIAGAALVSTAEAGSWHVLTEEEWSGTACYIARVSRRGWHGILRHLVWFPAARQPLVLIEDRLRNEPTIDACHELAKKTAARLTYRLDTSSAVEFDLEGDEFVRVPARELPLMMPDEAKTRGRPTDEDKRAVWQAQMGADPGSLIRASVDVALRAASGRAATGGASSSAAASDSDDVDLRAAGAGVATASAAPVCSSTAAWAGVAGEADDAAAPAAASPHLWQPAAAASLGALHPSAAGMAAASPRRSERQPTAAKPPLRGIELLASVAWHLEHTGSS